MNERIKELRKALGLTQQEFADRIRISRGALATYEIGRNEPIDAVIALICREFDVNEHWLRTGEGERFIQTTRSQDIADFVGKLMIGEEDNFKRRFIAMLARLDESEWEFIEKKALELFEDAKKD